MQGSGKKTAHQCKGFKLAINVFTAAMMGKSCVGYFFIFDEKLRFIFSGYSSFDPELYQRFRWSYDALPHLNVRKNLYCAMYAEDEEIDVQELVQMWVAEVLVCWQKNIHVYYELTNVCILSLI